MTSRKTDKVKDKYLHLTFVQLAALGRGTSRDAASPAFRFWSLRSFGAGVDGGGGGGESGGGRFSDGGGGGGRSVALWRTLTLRVGSRLIQI